MKGYIYEIKNNNTGKSYIGQTIQKPQKRWNNHNISTNTHIGRAINKYGRNNFSYYIIEEINLDTKEELRLKLNELEKYYINKFGTFKNGYNESSGSDYNRVLSEEARLKISNANKGKKLSSKTKEKIRQANIGKSLTKEHCRKISEANKGNKSALGIKHTKEARLNMSKAQKGHFVSKEQRKKLSEYNLNKYKSMSLEEKKQITGKANESKKKKVICVETGIIYNYVLEAQNINGIKGIGSVCNKKRKTAGGYRWKWYEEI